MGDQLYVYDINSKINNNNNNVNTCSIASSSLYNTQPPDEISMFLHQIMYRSSSSSSTSSSLMADTLPYTQNTNSQPLITSHGIFAGDPVNMSSGGEFLSGNVNVSGSNVSSSTVGVTENETVDEHERDCESEEGIEAVADEGPAKPAARCSKRARAAEVHNMSEKRRRSRINEKMKALQKLIPNSNKTDKASMLDEAIEYLKQLQLQVQVLTMRNGFSFHPLAMPGLLPPFQFSRMRMGFGQENGSLHMNSTGTLTMNHETPSQTMFSLPSQCSASNQLQAPNMSNMINSATSFGLDSSVLTHFGPFQLCTSSGETCGEDMLQHQQLNVNHSESNLSEFEVGTTATVLLPFGTQGSDLKDSVSLEACMIGRDQAEGVHSTNMDCSLLLSPHLTGMQTGISVAGEDIKLEGKDF